jgi:hypothetical protein
MGRRCQEGFGVAENLKLKTGQSGSKIERNGEGLLRRSKLSKNEIVP